MSRQLYGHPRPVDLENGMRIGSAPTARIAAEAAVSVARCRETTRQITDPVNLDETTHTVHRPCHAQERGRPQAAREMGFHAGWGKALDQLVDLAERI